jgi:O-6-methylguanine DNA methyltransferase
VSSKTVKFDRGPKISIHFHYSHGELSSARLTLSNSFTCIDGDEFLLSYLESYSKGILLPTSLTFGTSFQQRIAEEMKKIPFGKQLSYEELAILSGRPKACRAVGTTCGQNPFPLLIPCHRVVQKNGKLGGFSQGLEVKIRLLKFEAGKVYFSSTGSYNHS